MEMPERTTAIVIGDYELDRRPFTERGIELYKINVEDAPKSFNLAKAVIVADFPSKFSLIKDCYARIFPQAEDHGLALVVFAHSVEDHSQIDAIKKLDKDSSTSRIYEIERISAAAEH